LSRSPPAALDPPPAASGYGDGTIRDHDAVCHPDLPAALEIAQRFAADLHLYAA